MKFIVRVMVFEQQPDCNDEKHTYELKNSLKSQVQRIGELDVT
jgi:hypothetical protein